MVIDYGEIGLDPKAPEGHRDLIVDKLFHKYVHQVNKYI